MSDNKIYLDPTKSEDEQFTTLVQSGLHGAYTTDMFSVSEIQAFTSVEYGTNSRIQLTPKAILGNTVAPKYVYFNRIDLSKLTLTSLSYNQDLNPNPNIVQDIQSRLTVLGIPTTAYDVSIPDIAWGSTIQARVIAKPSSKTVVSQLSLPITFVAGSVYQGEIVLISQYPGAEVEIQKDISEITLSVEAVWRYGSDNTASTTINGLQYQWRYLVNGEWNNVPGDGESSTYLLEDISSDITALDGRHYKCTISNKYNNSTLDVDFVLKVKQDEIANPVIKIVSQTPPGGTIEVDVDSDIDFSVVGQLDKQDGSTPSGVGVTYQWQQTDSTGSWKNIDGAMSNTYKLKVVSASDKTKIQCIVSANGVDTPVATDPVTIDVKASETTPVEPPVVEGKHITYTIDPTGDLNLKQGSEFKLSVDAKVLSGDNKPTTDEVHYQWQVNKNHGDGWENLDNQTESSYGFTLADADANGWSYRCYLTTEEPTAPTITTSCMLTTYLPRTNSILMLYNLSPRSDFFYPDPELQPDTEESRDITLHASLIWKTETGGTHIVDEEKMTCRWDTNDGSGWKPLTDKDGNDISVDNNGGIDLTVTKAMAGHQFRCNIDVEDEFGGKHHLTTPVVTCVKPTICTGKPSEILSGFTYWPTKNIPGSTVFRTDGKTTVGFTISDTSNYQVDWGDGTVNKYSLVNSTINGESVATTDVVSPKHDYAKVGMYDITITNEGDGEDKYTKELPITIISVYGVTDIIRWSEYGYHSFNCDGDKLLTVPPMAPRLAWSETAGAGIRNYSSDVKITNDNIYFTRDFSNMFTGCKNFDGKNTEKWDFSKACDVADFITDSYKLAINYNDIHMPFVQEEYLIEMATDQSGNNIGGTPSNTIGDLGQSSVEFDKVVVDLKEDTIAKATVTLLNEIDENENPVEMHGQSRVDLEYQWQFGKTTDDKWGPADCFDIDGSTLNINKLFIDSVVNELKLRCVVCIKGKFIFAKSNVITVNKPAVKE